MDARALIQTLAPARARFLGLARGRVATGDDAEDVVQRALMRAADRAEQIQDPARARAWFYRILRHTIVDHHRSRAGDPARAHSSDGLDDIPDAGASEVRGNPCACALHLLTELHPAYAEVLRRVDLDGEEPAAVAATLGISAGNLHVKLHRARRALQSRVREHCGVSSLRPCLDCTCTAHHDCSAR